MVNKRIIKGIAFCCACIILVLAWYYSRIETTYIRGRQEIVYALIDSDHDPIAIMDEKGSILLWNKAMERLTGYTVDEAKQSGMALIVQDEQMLSKHTLAVQRALSEPSKHNQVAIISCVIYTKALHEIPVRIAVRVAVLSKGQKIAIAHLNPEKDVKRFVAP